MRAKSDTQQGGGNVLEIKLKQIVPGLKHIDSAHEGEWIDLRAAEDVDLEPFEYRKIRLGVAMQLPDGYEAIMAPRSSTYNKWGIIMACSIGIIDNSFNGDNDEWSFPAISLKRTKIHKNDRICQFRIVRSQPDCSIRVVDRLGNEDRGGFGSTGSR